MKAFKYIFILIILSSLLLSGCQPKTVVDEPVGVIELAFWTLLGGANGDRIQLQVDQFNASQDKIVIVNERQGGYNDLQQKLIAAVAAGDPPPLTMVDYKYVPFYAKNNVFVPITDYVSEADMADFIPGLLTDLTFDGNIYAVPYNRSTQGVFYNKDLMIEAGLDPEAPPETWEELVAMGPAIKALGDDYYVTYGKETNAQWMFEPLVYQFGGRVSDENCRFVFNLPGEGGLEVAEFLQDGVYDSEYFLIGANPTGGFFDASFEWVDGKVLFTRSSTALQGSLAVEGNVTFDWGFTKFPFAEGGTPAVTSGGANIAMTTNTTEAERAAAWEFMRYMSNTANSAWYHMETGYMPSRMSVLEMPSVQAYHEKFPSWLVSVSQLDYVQPTSCGVFNAPEWASVMQAALDRIVLNNEDPQVVLDDAADQLNLTIDSIPVEDLIK